MSLETVATPPMRERVRTYVISLQEEIVSTLEKLDPNAPPFKRDSWLRPQGGEGISCVFAVPQESEVANTTVLEKAGVNISIVHGKLPPPAIRQMRADHSTIPYDPTSQGSLPFFAAGISIVIHPRNPSAPTVHMNYRYFEITEPENADAGTATATAKIVEIGDEDEAEGENKKDEEGSSKVIAWWFGGGSDLTPSYFFEEDAKHFHSTLKIACDEHGIDLFPSFKKWCDEYFYIPHRQESRGIGGIFFDDLTDAPHPRLPENSTKRPFTAEDIFKFIQSAGNAFIPSYIPILERRKSEPADEHKRRWQLIRRGRYVEFNLVYDRGTKFGLMTPGARIESILMSLPETARWEYMSDLGTLEGSEEAKLVALLKSPKDWA